MATRSELIIEPGKGLGHYWRDLWSYKEVFYFLAWRDIAVRYKQTVIGVAWSVINPLLTMIVFTVIFGRWAQLPSDGVPYPVMVFAGMLPWQFFAGALGESSNSIISNQNLITKTYFPRLAIPFSAVMVSLVDFGISLIVLMLLMFIYQVPFTLRLLLLPLFTGFAFIGALGGGCWLAALNVKYRDFRYVVPFILQMGLYVSPVGFSTSIVPPGWAIVFMLNPMAGIIDSFRWAITGSPLNFTALLTAVLMVTIMLSSGLWYFRRTERSFADVI